MTEAELLANSDFIGFCGAWEVNRHCPFPLIDWCLDRDWPEGAEAARWVVEKEEREQVSSDGDFEHVCPAHSFSQLTYWWDTVGTWNKQWSDDVPLPASPNEFDSFPAAIAYYLCNFDPTLAARYPPRGASMLT